MNYRNTIHHNMIFWLLVDLLVCLSFSKIRLLYFFINYLLFKNKDKGFALKINKQGAKINLNDFI